MTYSTVNRLIACVALLTSAFLVCGHCTDAGNPVVTHPEESSLTATVKNCPFEGAAARQVF